MTTEKEKIKIIPLGGLGAIGKNMTVLEYMNDIIVIDCGIMFPSESMPGIDFIIPDFTYVIKNSHRIRGIILTHGHEDHIGAVPYLFQQISAPIYGTKLTLGLIQSRFEERPPKEAPVYVEISHRDVVHIGNFIIEFIRMNHSIVDGVGLAIQTPVGTIIHTGDFKIDYSSEDGTLTDLFKLADYGERGVLLLMSDSTNADREGFTRSESVLNERLFEIFAKAKGRIIVASFASNISRIQQVFNAARKYNRKVIISGLTMQKNIDISHSLGYLTFKNDQIINYKESKKIPLKKQVVMCTGTQGEPMSALSRIANGTHKHFVAGEDDIVIITASIIPGNEKEVNNVINSLVHVGAEVYYEMDDDIHVSGHASQEELKTIISITKPTFFVPIHGEFMHLRAHARLAQSLKIKASRIIMAENGDILELTPKTFEKAGSIPLDEIYVDGRDPVDKGSVLINERQSLSTEGILIITIVMSQGVVVAPPEIFSKGFISSGNEKIKEKLSQELVNHIEKLLFDEVTAKQLKSSLKKNFKNIVYNLTRKNPIIEVQVIEV